jgi:hypothetical protein
MDNAEYEACIAACKEKYKNISKPELIALILENQCTMSSSEHLEEHYTLLGLTNMLCSCLCSQDCGGNDDTNGDEKSGAPSLDLDPPLHKILP